MCASYLLKHVTAQNKYSRLKTKRELSRNFLLFSHVIRDCNFENFDWHIRDSAHVFSYFQPFDPNKGSGKSLMSHLCGQNWPFPKHNSQNQEKRLTKMLFLICESVGKSSAPNEITSRDINRSTQNCYFRLEIA